MGRFANSWEITKASGRVIRADRELLLLPVLSGLASLLTMALIAGIGWTNGILPNFTDAQGQLRPVAIALGAVAYLVLAFVNVFFAAALIAGAHERFSGGDPTLGSCLRAAGRRTGRLFAWAAITATVSVALRILSERGGLAGKIAASLGSLAWSLATYFIIPVLLFENASVPASIGRSGGLFKKTWGETVVGTGGAGLVFFLAFIPIVLVIFLAASSKNLAVALPVIVIAVAAGVFLAILHSAFNGVYRAALDRFATTGEAPGGFAPQYVQNAFVPK